MERIRTVTAYEGKVIDVRTDTFRYDDGEEADREIVAHPGAVGIVAHGDGVVWLVRQPREAVGDPELLEVPAGKLDVEGESHLDCAKRELAEEVGLEAAEWSEWKRFFTSPGFAEEEVTIFEATGLREVDDHEPDPDGADRGRSAGRSQSSTPRSPRAATRSRSSPSTCCAQLAHKVPGTRCLAPGKTSRCVARTNGCRGRGAGGRAETCRHGRCSQAPSDAEGRGALRGAGP